MYIGFACMLVYMRVLDPFGPGVLATGVFTDRCDVKESSYHLLISRPDLHICDDSQSREPGAQRPEPGHSHIVVGPGQSLG